MATTKRMMPTRAPGRSDLQMSRIIRALSDRHRDNKPWYKQPSIVLSTIAVIISLASTASTLYFHHSDVVNLRKDLLVKTISNISEIRTQRINVLKERLSGEEVDRLLDLLSGQEAMQARNAYLIAKSLDTSATALEMQQAASALGILNAFDLSEDLLEKAKALAENPIEYIAISSDLGSLRISNEKVELGDKDFQSAEEMFSKNPAYFKRPEFKLVNMFQIQMNWAKAYSQIDCDSFAQHLIQADNIIEESKKYRMPFNRMKDDLDNLKTSFCNSTPPSG